MARWSNRFRGGLIAGIVILFSIVLYCVGYTVTGPEESILNTLARVQAAIFAIVFSVLILGVQLSASRYSPRLASEFRSDPGYIWTVGVFGVSIGFDVVILFAIPAASGFFTTILLVVGIGLAILAFWTMWDFVNGTLEKTTPEGILRTLEENITPTSIVVQARKSAEDPLTRDPFITLISVLRSIIEEGDRVSAIQGLRILEKKVNDLLENTSNDEFEEGTPVDKSLEHLFSNQLPTLLEESLDEKLTQTAIQVTETAENIGEISTAEELEKTHEHVLRGQIGLIDKIGYEHEHERVRNEIIGVCKSLIESGVEHSLWSSSAVGTRLLGWRGAASIMERDFSENYDGRYTRLLINGFPKILNNAVDSEAELTEYRDTAWLNRSVENVDPLDLLVWACYDSMAELSSAGLRYEIKTGQSLLNWIYVAQGWTKGFEKLTETDLESITQIWFGTILYLEYINEITNDEVLNGFDANATTHVDNDFAIETIQNILTDNIKPTSRIDHIPGAVNPLKMPRSGYPSSPVSDPDTSFQNWLEQEREVYSFLGETTGQSDSSGTSDPADNSDSEEDGSDSLDGSEDIEE